MSQRGRTSQAGTAESRGAKDALDRKANELIQYYIMRMRSPHVAIKRTEIVKDVLGDEYSKDFLALNEVAAKRLRDIFGIELRDADALEKGTPGNKSFMLVNRHRVSNNDEALRLDHGAASALVNQKRGLLKFILCLIRAYGGEVSESNFLRALTRIGVSYAKSEEHPQFGDVKKLLEEFKKAGYIDTPNGALTGNSDSSQSVRFGTRARVEFEDRGNKDLFDAIGIRAEMRIQP